MDVAENLVQRMLAAPSSTSSDAIAAVANELLNAYYGGSDIKSLCRLLESKDERLARFGVWIASELGKASKQFSGMLCGLLTHNLKDVRFCALDCALSWTADESGREVATAVALVDDEEKAVRWKALGFLSGAT